MEIADFSLVLKFDTFLKNSLQRFVLVTVETVDFLHKNVSEYLSQHL